MSLVPVQVAVITVLAIMVVVSLGALVVSYRTRRRLVSEIERVGALLRESRRSTVGLVRRVEDRFATILDHAPIMIDSFDEDGRCVLWNRECERTLGWSQDEMTAAADPLALFYPDPAMRAKVMERIRRADGRFREYEVLVRDGSKRFQSWADFKLPDGSMISVGYDTTTRKKAELALADSEEKYRAVFNGAHDGIMLADVETGFIVECNPQFEELTGRPLVELRSTPVWELRPPDQVEKARTLFGRFSRDRFITADDQLFQKPNGEIVHVELHARKIDIAGNEYAQAVVRDITDRKRITEALQQRDERIRLIIEQIPAVLWTTDRDLVLTSCVGAGLDALNLKPNQIAGMSLYQYFDSRDDSFTPIAMHLRALKGESTAYELVWSGVSFDCHAEPLRDSSGKIIGCIGVGLNVSEARRTERELQHSQEQMRALATRLQAVREEESAMISREIHDELGQELTVLKMDISWVLRRLDRRDNGVGAIIDKLEAMACDVDQTIDTVRRISTQLRPGILDDLGLIGALEWQTQEFENRTGISCEFATATKQLQLDSDRSTAVFRIYQEILTNVARHARADRVVADLTSRNGTLVLNVSDNGRGISLGEIESPRALGILGMRERAQVCGGKVLIGRESDRGTRVMVEIPINQGAL